MEIRVTLGNPLIEKNGHSVDTGRSSDTFRIAAPAVRGGYEWFIHH
jgi:hypothetical protein